LGTIDHADEAVTAAKAAFPDWRNTPWQERIALLRKAADLIDKRLFDIVVATTFEVGKNRMEALGDVSEAPALIRYVCDQMEENQGFVKTMGFDPIPGIQVNNSSTLQPYGVWLVISPFNFPTALTVGPVGAALAAGNTVVMKPAGRTPWSVRLLAGCFHETGLPAGTVNFVTGSGSVIGQALIDHHGVDGVTFTGSYPVGMGIYRQFSQKDNVHPVILELGGKNPAIVTQNADLERAVNGIVRSAFGLQGQICSANSRVYLEAPIYDEVPDQIVAETEKLVVGDPALRATNQGPVISDDPYREYQEYSEELDSAGSLATGGNILQKNEYQAGHYAAPTVAVGVPTDHLLWKKELFLPITMIHKVQSAEEAIHLANDIIYDLTTGFYGNEEEGEDFFNASEAGVNYLNRPQGSTTGAWPAHHHLEVGKPAVPAD
jgi:1-pyrroline-5-carboxylate dehydrogenase